MTTLIRHFAIISKRDYVAGERAKVRLTWDGHPLAVVDGDLHSAILIAPPGAARVLRIEIGTNELELELEAKRAGEIRCALRMREPLLN